MMSSIPPGIARIRDPALLIQDPLACLADARARQGDQIVLREGGALLSGGSDCPGVIALFGAAWQRQVLTAPHAFRAAPSTARALGLPDDVVGLTKSLHVMDAREHVTHKAALVEALGKAAPDVADGIVDGLIARFADAWLRAGEIALFPGLQRLSAEIAVDLLFGAGHADSDILCDALTRFFALRRGLSRGGAIAPVVDAGQHLERLLRETLGGRRRGGGVARRLAGEIPDTAAIAHLNVLFMSLVEPVAVAATWMLLILTQRPRLRYALRESHRCVRSGSPCADMRHAVLETVRLLSPNALMVRVASSAFDCAGAMLPPGCEIVLAPFLSHRDPAVFADPIVFRPMRWASPPVASPFAFLPFGAGVHACVGKRLAESLIGRIVGGVLARLEPSLCPQQMIDWQIDITFRPRSAFRVTATPVAQELDRSVEIWRGPVANLVQFEPE